MSFRRLCKKPLLFRSLTGLTVPEFDQISTEMDSKYEEYERRRLSRRKRKRDVGAGRPFKLKPRERLLMLLVIIIDCTLHMHYRDFYLILIRAMYLEI